MKQLFLLENSIKNYEWGSTSAIPALCGTPADGKPQAEVWMGAHPQSSSRLVDAREAKAASAPHGEGAAGGTISLDRFIEENPIAALGARDSERFGTLPFLFKLLAAGKPLSIQVHPSLAQAQEGWARENAAGLPVTDAKRNYKDDNHKPEILCALTKFTAMAGFRPLEETVPILEALGLDILAPILAQMKSRNESAGLKTLLEGLFALPPESKEAIFEALPDACTRLEASTIDGVPSSEISTLIKNLMAHYPGDIGVLAPCYLNIVQLQPGEAIFVDAGILHSYVEGLGVELMANSDNVINHKLLQWIEGQLEPGRTESQVSWLIEKFFRENGASELAFANIVAVGKNAALPHAIPGDEPVIDNCPVLVDIGCRVDDYCSDQTRTFWVGQQPTDAFRRTYDLVRQAQASAIESMRPGQPLRDAYGHARAVFEKAGTADAFTHGLGHGVGLETHEAPSLSPRAEGVLEPGMVVTVEPGLYYRQWGGVRWEYTVLVEEDGVRIL